MNEVATAADVMRILGAVYDVEQPRERWLTGILESMAPTLDRGAGVGGLLYDVSCDSQVHVDFMKGINVSSGWMEAGIEVHRDARFIPQIVAAYRSVLCATLSDIDKNPQVISSLRSEFHHRHGVREQIMVNGVDCSGKGCTLYLFSPRRITLSDPQRDLFSRLATHLSTAYRLQRQLASTEQTKTVGAEAILTPAGQIDHAEAGARSVSARRELNLAVRRRERARVLAARDAERVVKSLEGLVDARWTLVDHYEIGGKRYVVARENAPKPIGPARLSRRERQVVALAALGRTNKLIAYELGLAYSTVRVLMARASGKLGTTTRSQLVARQDAIAAQRTPP